MSDAPDADGGPAGRPPGPPPVALSHVPLFPLPNVVLFPRAVLPLHIFEERYKAMTADALDGPRQIAMALLRPGWEKCYHAAPAVDPVVCVGTILTHEKLPDGKYNFLLQGHARAKIVAEDRSRAYRVAALVPLAETTPSEASLSAERADLSAVFTAGPFAGTAVGRQFARLLASPLPTPDLADLVAFNFLDDVNLKQSLLADTDVRRRVARVLAALADARPLVPSASVRMSRNPGVN